MKPAATLTSISLLKKYFIVRHANSRISLSVTSFSSLTSRARDLKIGFRGGMYALGVWLGQVRLAMNALLIKRGVGWEK